ncbi:hypothetical protein K432DRAFT_214494 [Lepidopterella palustris CBS 459.81]|uniref:Uncharacterized protein n=1 Tax=Lepidopterella palustris CBS 459.81 TaxID=1314670 RepID=A0A8E2EF35_9PEZI|nr:hypothetical protein K432DRAFT_214494 [Lepidopterella palustris CBS 459.81]
MRMHASCTPAKLQRCGIRSTPALCFCLALSYTYHGNDCRTFILVLVLSAVDLVAFILSSCSDSNIWYTSLCSVSILGSIGERHRLGSIVKWAYDWMGDYYIPWREAKPTSIV